MSAMYTIKFEGVYFADLEALSDYVAERFGSWLGVPKEHPQYVVAQSLAALNADVHVVVGGIAINHTSESCTHASTCEAIKLRGRCCGCDDFAPAW